MIRRIIILFVFFFTLCTLHFTQIYAAEKNWSGGGDGTTWSDDDNWFPAVTPATTDDVTIDVEGASVVCTQTFKARSITVGGRTSCTLTSNNFVYGTVTPDFTSDVALYNKRDGTVTLKGAGTITLGGEYKDSEEVLTPEPSFMFQIK